MNTTCLEPLHHVSSILMPIFILEFILGLPGNVFALWVFFFKSPWKACNVYLFCLVTADLLLLIGLPFRIDYLFRGEDWIFGEHVCRFVLYIISVNYSASMAFMTILAVDRFFRILRPHHAVCRLSVRQGIMTVSAVWVGILLIRLPPALTPVLHTNATKITCDASLLWTSTSLGLRIYNSIHLTEVLIAFVLVVFCFVRVFSHARERQLKAHRRVNRAVRLLLFIVIMFVFCFLPTGISGILLQGFPCSEYLQLSLHFSLAISYMNSALDPVIYCHTNAWFRDTLKAKSNSAVQTQFKMSFKTNKKPKP